MLKSDAAARATPHLLESNATTAIDAVILHTNLTTKPNLFGSFDFYIPVFDDFMRLDTAALTALSVFPRALQANSGPSAGPSVSPSASLYGLLGAHVATPMGHRTLQRWLRQPLRDENVRGMF